MKHFTVSEELHKSGKPHLHALVTFEKRLDVTSSDFFDLWLCDDGGELSHPNVEILKKPIDVFRWYEYLKKEDPEPLSEGESPTEPMGKTSRSHDVATAILKGKPFHEIVISEPGYSLQNLRRMKEFLGYVQQTKAREVLEPWVPLNVDDFAQETTRLIVSWLNRNVCLTEPRPIRQLQLYLHGPPNCGKSVFFHLLRRRLRIYSAPHENFFNDYSDEEYDLVLFDEFYPSRVVDFDWSVMKLFLDGSVQNLRLKGSSVIKSRNLPVVIISNYSLRTVCGRDEQLWEAMRTRVEQVTVPPPHPELGQRAIELDQLRVSLGLPPFAPAPSN